MTLFYLVLFLVSLIFFNFKLLLVSLLLGWIFAGISVSGIYHRKISHNSWDYKNKFCEYLSYLLVIASGQGSPLTWAYIHRLHHKHSDTDLDPQRQTGGWKINILFSLYKITKFEPRIVRDIVKDKNLMMLHTHWYKFVAAYAICWSLVDPILMLYIVGSSSVFCSLWIGIFNTVSHSSNTSNDIKFPLLLWGENEHRVHHLNSSQLQLSRFDIGFYLITLLKK